MSYIGDPERITQNRIVQLFKNQLGYEYYGDWTDRANNSNIETHYLKRYWATSPYTTEQQNEAIHQLQQAANNASKSLYERNKAVYTLLRNGAKVKTSIAEKTQTIHFIDWKNRQNNDFAIAEEVTVKFENIKRPDIVLYVNGIALGVIELKKSTVSVSEGIIQNLDNQKKKFIEPFFSTMQFVMAGNDSEGLRYGTIETPAKFYLSWKEESHQDSEPLDQHILQLTDKARFLELVHDFVIFDGGIKKTSRPHQYFGVKAAQERIKAREGGVIWHTQGSGKSLTMVWLTNWILENITDPRVLIITDRDELDKQIRDVFEGVQQKIHRSKSGKDLIEVLNKSEELLICSLVHKFGLKKKDSTKIKSKIQTDEEYNAYITDLLSNLPKDFKAKGDVFVFVDECHRTQSGLLNKAMKKVLPDSVFIGFTGTPLLKQDKQTSYENFGTPIHTYKFNEAVKDGVVLDLRYEARNVEQYIGSQEKIDKWFDAKTKELKENAKAELKKRWGTMQKVLSSKERLEQIANDIILDFETKDRLSNGRGNAILVAGRIYEACKYYEIFQQKGFKKCAIVTSYVPNKNDLKGETVSEEEETQKIEQYEIYQEMLKGKDPETFENEVKETFTKSPAQMKLLIVVDKLLTGFDAPACT
jgi:type I restriction enzyme, R subunit